MSSRSIAALLVVLSLKLSADEPPALSIPEMLSPATRLHAFQQYCLQADAHKGVAPTNLKLFGKSHQNLAVSELRTPRKKMRYVVSWSSGMETSDLDEIEGDSRPAGAAASVLTPHELSYQIFSADGKALTKVDFLMEGDSGIIADLYGDGDLQVVDRVALPAGLGNYEMSPSGVVEKKPKKEGGLAPEYLVVHPLESQAPAALAVVYNTDTEGHPASNPWAFQLRSTGSGKPYLIEIGPALGSGGVEPKVIFRWDGEAERWVGPESKPGDHFRVITGRDTEDVLVQAGKMANAGGLGYPVLPPPAVAPALAGFKQWPANLEELPPEKLSKPYHAESLAGLSDERLLVYMGSRRSALDFVTNRMRETTSLAGFWTMDPAAAAVAYVRCNRPPELAAKSLLSISNPNQEAAPTEGDATLIDGVSCDGSVFVHQLHCAVAGSFVVYLETARSECPRALIEAPAFFEARKADLPYEDARRLLQTIWWLTRVRSRSTTDRPDMDYRAYSSRGSGDASAAIQIAWNGRRFGVRGIRSSLDPRYFRAVGDFSSGYDISGLLNLCVQIFRRELPSRLGPGWKSMETPLYWNEALGARRRQTPEDLARVKAVTADLFRLAGEGKLGTAAVRQAVHAVGEYGWRDLRPAVEALAAKLPPASETEKRLAEMNAELKAQAAKLGDGASHKGHWDRQGRRFAATHEKLKLKQNPVTPEEEAKFGAYDKLWTERDEVSSAMPEEEQQIALLREAIPVTLRKVEVFSDAEKLRQWGLEEREAEPFAVSRLAQLDRKRAIELLRSAKQKAEDKDKSRAYADAIRTLLAAMRPAGTAPEPLPAGRLGSLLAGLRNIHADEADRSRALAELIPAGYPQNNPDPQIDAALVELLNRPAALKEADPDGLPMAAAQRLGDKAWEPLLAYAASRDDKGVPRLPKTLPALTLLAPRQPTPERARLTSLLAPELHETFGGLDAVLWSIWQLDLRDLKPEVERIATSGPDDYEGTQGGESGKAKTPVKHRYHRARQIAALWNEQDAVTRGRLLIAFAVAHARDFADATNGALAHLQAQLADVKSGLPPEQRAAFGELIEWSKAHAAEALPGAVDPAQLDLVLKGVGN